MIELIINNNKYVVEKHLTVLQACEQAQIDIPRFCYHEKLSVAGNCRMCLVEIEKSPKPVASCAMPINQGMVIFTDTPLVKKARESMIEFLLIHHPLDCPICDQGGECDLQDITLNFGSDRSRFFEWKHGVEDKDCGPIIKTIMTRCIHCTRCIRFLTELANVEVFGALGRGEHMEIGSFLNKYLKTELSGNLVDLCPVGALTSKPYAFKARAWELKKIESVDFLDGFGSNIVIYTKNHFISKQNLDKGKENTERDHIVRILPKLNNSLNENWISDKTRYAFDSLFSSRCDKMYLQFRSVPPKKFFPTYEKWNWTAIDLLLDHFFRKNISEPYGLRHFIGNIGSIASVEEMYFFFKMFRYFGPGHVLMNNQLFNFCVDVPLFYQFNTSFNNIEKSDLIFLINTNPRVESSMLNLKIRKHFFNKECFIAYLGNYQEFMFPIYHVGNSLKALIQIAEGKHKFSKNLRSAKYPLMIVGSDLSTRVNFDSIQSILFFIAKKSFLNLKNFIGYNLLQQNLGQIHWCDLGCFINPSSFLHHLKFDKTIFDVESWHFPFFNYNLDVKPLEQIPTFCSFKSFFEGRTKERYIFPIKTLYERDSLLINNEGLIQQSFKAITPTAMLRNGEDIIRMLLLRNNNFSYRISHAKNLTFKRLYLLNPFLKTLYFKREKFNYNFLKFGFSTKKINYNFENQQWMLNDFYQRDILSQHSKVLSECNLLYANSKLNFLE